MRCLVEEAGLAVLGYSSVRSASRVNGAIVMFLDSTTKVTHATFTLVSPLVNPATKVILSNVPPFIPND